MTATTGHILTRGEQYTLTIQTNCNTVLHRLKSKGEKMKLIIMMILTSIIFAYEGSIYQFDYSKNEVVAVDIEHEIAIDSFYLTVSSRGKGKGAIYTGNNYTNILSHISKYKDWIEATKGITNTYDKSIKKENLKLFFYYGSKFCLGYGTVDYIFYLIKGKPYFKIVSSGAESQLNEFMTCDEDYVILDYDYVIWLEKYLLSIPAERDRLLKEELEKERMDSLLK